MVGVGPLIAGHTRYTNPAFRQFKTCIFFAKFFQGAQAVSLIRQSGPPVGRTRPVASSDFRRFAKTGTLQSFATDEHGFPQMFRKDAGRSQTFAETSLSQPSAHLGFLITYFTLREGRP